MGSGYIPTRGLVGQREVRRDGMERGGEEGGKRAREGESKRGYAEMGEKVRRRGCN